jgi:hypothetical protein
MITKHVEGDIVCAMGAAVKWAKDIGARRPKSDNDNDSGEVYFQAGKVKRTIRVRTNPAGAGFVLMFE